MECLFVTKAKIAVKYLCPINLVNTVPSCTADHAETSDMVLKLLIMGGSNNIRLYSCLVKIVIFKIRYSTCQGKQNDFFFT